MNELLQEIMKKTDPVLVFTSEGDIDWEATLAKGVENEVE